MRLPRQIGFVGNSLPREHALRALPMQARSCGERDRLLLLDLAVSDGLLLPVARQCQPEDLLHHRAELLAQRPGVVRNAVALANLAHLDRDLAVAVRWDVREHVVLDLVAEVP